MVIQNTLKHFLFDLLCSVVKIKKIESITFAKDKIALGLVRARNRKRGGRSNIGLDDDAWTSGTICDRPLSESDL